VFELSIIDHLRLSFGSVLAAYEGHADAAARLSRWGWYARLATLCCAAAATVLSGIALQTGRGFQIGTMVAATATLGICAAYIAFDPGPRIYGHRASAARLWVVCERYRALLAEVHDNLVDVPGIRERRNALLLETAAVLEQAPPDDRYTYEIARRALSGAQGTGFSDADLDRYLPASLRKGAAPQAAVAQ
jgi:hypothetical protein